MIKWSSIDQYRHVVKRVRQYCKHNNVPPPIWTFSGTVKLHGTNAGISRQGYDGEYVAQGRNTVLTTDADNYGFANWLEERLKDPHFKSQLDNLFYRAALGFNETQETTIFGEWVGPGIQGTVAVSQLPHKSFVIFGAHVNGEYVENKPTFTMDVDDVHNVLLAGQHSITIDFNSPNDVIDELERLTLEVENECPFGKALGISGIGEGIVWTCDERPDDSELWFKTKGSKHSGGSKDKSRKVATTSPEELDKLNDVLDYVLTDARLRQGLENVDAIEYNNIGQYLKWIGQDVKKEESDTLEANGYEWKNVSKHITDRARKFFIECIDRSL